MPNVEYRGMNLVIPENDSEWREHFKLARGHKLMLRACQACGLMRYPPTHTCPWCMALEWNWKEVSGQGHIYSYEIVHHAIQPVFQDLSEDFALPQFTLTDEPPVGRVWSLPS